MTFVAGVFTGLLLGALLGVLIALWSAAECVLALDKARVKAEFDEERIRVLTARQGHALSCEYPHRVCTCGEIEA